MKGKTIITVLAGAFLATVPMFADEVDYTSSITNPSFETNGLAGWISKGFQSQTNNSPADVGWEKDGKVYAEVWVSAPGPLSDASLSQEVGDLPNGDYILRALGHSINQSGTPEKTKGTWLYTLQQRVEVNVAGEYEVRGTVAEGVLTIGFKTESTDANWVAVDNFRIYRTGESLEGYKGYLDALVAELNELFGEEEKPAEYNKDEIEAALKAAGEAATKEEIMAAISQLREAERSYKAAKEAERTARYAYSRTKSEINIAEMFYEDSDYAGKEEFRKAIDDAKAVFADAANGPAEYDAAIARLKAASAAYKANRPSEWVRIKNGAMWKDSEGNDVQAHGAGFLLVNDRYYMIGEDRSNSWNPDVNMYSSKDLVNWKFERKIIENKVTHPDLGSSRMIERPKLMYNALSGNFVVWCHWEASNYGASEAGVFYSDVVNAPYTYHAGERPMGIKSRDCNVYVDDDGTAYFISTTSENTNLGLFRLSDDYLDPVEHTLLFQGQKREAPAIVKHEGRYYMLSSACSGWDPNACKLSYTDDLTHGWSSLKQVGNPISFDTQAASILKVEGSKATTYLYVGDRWQDPSLPESKTIIFPISFGETDCTFEYLPEFEINFATGEWRKVESGEYVAKDDWTLLDCSSEETKSEDTGAVKAFDGDTSTFWHTNYSGTGGSAPHHIAVDMGKEYEISGFLAAPRNDMWSTNGLIREFVFEVSTDAENWTVVSAGAWLPYWAEVKFPTTTARYFRLTSLSGSYATVSEIDIVKGGEGYTPLALAANYKIDSGSWTEGSDIEVGGGSVLTLGPNVDGTHGSWATLRPDGTVKAGRELEINDIGQAHAGTYRSFFVDMYNTTHTVDFTVKVNGDSGLESVESEAEVVSREYYTLEGLRCEGSVRPAGIYIVREVLSDGSVRTGKQAVR